jgi:hypothetical protein
MLECVNHLWYISWPCQFLGVYNVEYWDNKWIMIGKDVEENSRGVIWGVLSASAWRGGENQGKPQWEWAVSRSKFEPSTSGIEVKDVAVRASWPSKKALSCSWTPQYVSLAWCLT